MELKLKWSVLETEAQTAPSMCPHYVRAGQGLEICGSSDYVVVLFRVYVTRSALLRVTAEMT